MKGIYPISLVLMLMLQSCTTPNVDEVLLNSAPGNYSILYNREFGLFIVKQEERTDTISLWDNWLYALYRYRQQEKNISLSTNYDEFLKSDFFCLPGSEQQFAALNSDPLSAFTNSIGPAMCDCMTERGTYNSGSPACEEKFQSFRIAYDDNLNWYYSYFISICKGELSDTISIHAYKDSILNVAKRAELAQRERERIQDSIDGPKPKVRCSGTDYIPKHARASSYREYEQCRAMTTSGRCRRHGG